MKNVKNVLIVLNVLIYKQTRGKKNTIKITSSIPGNKKRKSKWSKSTEIETIIPTRFYLLYPVMNSFLMFTLRGGGL